MFIISIITDLSLTYYGQDIIDESKQLLIRAVEGVGIRAHVALWLTDGTFTLGK
jgi:hypothetical protein